MLIINGDNTLIFKHVLSEEIYSRISNGLEINIDVIEVLIKNILNSLDENSLYNELNNKQQEEVNQLIKILNQSTIRNKPTTIASIDELTIGKKNMLEDNIILERMITESNVSKQTDRLLLDFASTGYPNTIQNYLIEYIYTEGIDSNIEIPKGLYIYKRGGFFHYANLLRGNFLEIEKTYIDETRKEELSCDLAFQNRVLIPDVVRQIIELQELMKKMPKRKYDIIINRIEGHVDDALNRTQTSGLLSFSSSDNIEFIPGRGRKENIDYYKMILPKNMMCLPIELIAEETIQNAGLQCEFLMPYFSYDILSTKSIDNNRKITIGNPKVMDVRKLILKRLQELQENEKDNPNCTEQLHKDINEALDIVTRSLENDSNDTLGKKDEEEEIEL